MNRYRKIFRLCTVVLALVITTSSFQVVLGQITAAQSGLWSDASTWVGGTVPSYQEVIIPSGVEVTYNGTMAVCANKTIAGKLIVTGDYDCGWGTINLSSDASIDVAGNAKFGIIITGDNCVIIVGSKLSTNGASTIGNSCTVTIGGNLETNGEFTIEESTIFRIDGTFKHNTLVTINGEVYVEGDYTPSGGSIVISSTGKLVVKGDASSSLGTTIDGTLLVSGDFTFGGGSIDVGSSGAFVIGGDLTSGINITVDANGYLGVFGNFTNTAGGPTINGEMVIVGDQTGPCLSCENELEDNDPVWGTVILEGINAIFYEAFNYADGTMVGVANGVAWSSSDASVQSGLLEYTNSGAAGYAATLWFTDEIYAGCNDRISISGDVVTTGSVTAYFEYSIDGGITWNEIINHTGTRYSIDAIETSQIMLRLRVDNMDTDATVSLDGVLVSATNEGGVPPVAIVLGDVDTEVCAPGDGAYSITNEGNYSEILWSIESGSGSFVGAANNASCIMRWTSLPATLKVTATGGDCGGTGSTTFRLISVTGTTDLSLGIEKTNISCNGLTNGSITVNVCGATGTPTFQWEETDFYQSYIDAHPGAMTSNSLSDLYVGIFTITVTDGSESITEDIRITEPLPLTASYAPVFCGDADPVGSGYLITTVTGGTEPYLIVLSGAIPDPDPDPYPATNTEPVDTFLNLLTGTYHVNVSDLNGCAIDQEDFDFVVDNESPSCLEYPKDTTLKYSVYKALDNDLAVLPINNSSTNEFDAANADTIFYEFNAGAFNDLRLYFDLFQGGGTWDAVDSIVVYLDYDGEPFSKDYKLYSDYGDDLLIENADNITLPAYADGIENLGVYVLYFTQGKALSISNLNLRGYNLSSVILPEDYGIPQSCTDNQGAITITYSDGPVQWLCNDGPEGNDDEFYFIRTFAISDGCNLIYDTQNIGVGNYPEIEEPSDTILDFCHNTNVVLPIPGYSDGCSAVSIKWDVFVNGVNVIPNNGSPGTLDDEITITSFPQPVANDTVYTIRWVAMDLAGLTDTIFQNVTIYRPIHIPLSGPAYLCSGDLTTFTISFNSGSGVYNTAVDPTISIPGTWTWVTESSGSFETQDLLNPGTQSFTVQIFDLDNEPGKVNGGCDVTLEFDSDNFSVRQKIQTLTIEVE